MKEKHLQLKKNVIEKKEKEIVTHIKIMNNIKNMKESIKII